MLDEGKQELLRPYAEHQPADRRALAIAREGDERNEEIEAQLAVAVGDHFAVPRLVHLQRLRQQGRRVRHRAAKLADLEQRCAERIHQQGRCVLDRIDRGNQVRADRFAHGTVTAVVPQRGDLPHQPGGGHDHGPVVLPLVQPVLDLAGLEVGNGLQIGKGFALDLRLVNLEHDEAGQGDERGKRNEQRGAREGTDALASGAATRNGRGAGDRRSPFPEDDVEQAAGYGDEEQPLGDFDSPLQDRVVDAHVQQDARNGDPERGKDRIEQGDTNGRQSPLVALWIN